MNEFVIKNGYVSNDNSRVIGALTANTFIKSGGTSVQYLMADGSVTTGVASGGITGTGTTNTIPKFNSTSGLTNSNLSDNGTIVSSSTDMSINGLTVGRGNGNAIHNTTLGYQSFNANTTGFYCNSVGYQSLVSNIGGTYNDAFGAGALGGNTNGIRNNGFGFAALGSNITGAYNIAMGMECLGGIEGSANVGLGYQAGKYLTDASTIQTLSNNSIFLGYHTKSLGNNQTNQIVIGSDTDGLGSNSVVLGNDSITKTALKGNVLVGTTTDDGINKLQVNGSATVNKLKYISSISINNVDLNTLTDAGFYYGSGLINAPAGVIGSWVTIERYHSDNTYVHQTLTDAGTGRIYSRLRQASTWGVWVEMLITTSGGSSNAILNQTTITQTGGFNISTDSKINGLTIGRGGGNIDSNSSFGNSALQNNTTGSGNIGVGQSALLFNISGSGNTGIGVDAGSSKADFGQLTNTDNSVFVGRLTKASGNGQTNQIVIGYNATGIGSNSVVLGNDSVTKTALKGNVLIGTTTDNDVDKLQVNGSTNITTTLTLGTSWGTGKYVFDAFGLRDNTTGADTGGLAFNFYGLNGGTSFFRDTTWYNGKTGNIMSLKGSTGNLLIGTTTDNGYKLQVDSSFSNDTALFQRVGTFGSVIRIGRSGVSSGVTLDYPLDNTFAVSTAGSERIRIAGNNGNLLIGTTTDNGVDKLQVNGAILSTNGLQYTRSLSITSANLNNITNAGFYNGTSLVNAPTAGFYYITVERYFDDASWVHQTATSFGSGNIGNRVYTRTREVSVWTEWKELLTTTSGGTSNAILNQTSVVQSGGFNISSNSVINGVRIGLGVGNVSTNTVLGTLAYDLGAGTGSRNTAIGETALRFTAGASNVGVGSSTLYFNNTGSRNTAIGDQALLNISTSDNIGIGYLAGNKIADKTTNNSNSTNSIFVGYNTSPLATGQTNQIVIGHDANGLGSNSVVLGNDSITKTALKGNVLIDTTIDNGAKLQVNGTATFANTVNIAGGGVAGAKLNVTGNIFSLGSTYSAPSVIGDAWNDNVAVTIQAGGTFGASSLITLRGTGTGATQTNRLEFYTSTLERMRLSTGGNLLIGTQTDNNVDKLQIAGTQKIDVGSISERYGLVIHNRGVGGLGTAGGAIYLADNGLADVGTINQKIGKIAFGMFPATTATTSHASIRAYTDTSYVNGRLSFYTATDGTSNEGFERMTIKNNGNVLIGTTTDNGIDKLQVNGSISATNYKGAIAVPDTRAIVTTPETTAFPQVRFDFKQKTTESLSGEGGTYFGEITIRPYGSTSDWSGGHAHQLGFTDSGGLYHRSGSNTTWGNWYKILTTGNGGVNGTGTANFLPKWSSTTGITNSQIYDNGTTVGIGTSLPQQKLHISGNTALSGRLFFGPSPTDDSHSILYSSTLDGLEFRGWSGHKFNTFGSNERMRITFGGNVLIGTTADTITDKLQVSGTIKTTSSIQVGDNETVASVSNVGSLRYRDDSNNSYVDMCMKTGTTAYGWVTIVQNNF